MATQNLIEGVKSRKKELAEMKKRGKLTAKQKIELIELNRFIKQNEKHFYPRVSYKKWR